MTLKCFFIILLVGVSSACDCDEKIAVLEKKLNQQETVLAAFIEKVNKLEEAKLKQEKEESGFQGNTAEINELLRTNQRRFVLNEGPVAFTAAIAPVALDHVKDKEIVRFETTITDIGAGYNNLTGVFVVPITGIYIFSSSLMDHYGDGQIPIHGGLMVRGEIVHNTKVVGRVFARAEHDHRDQGAQTVFIYAVEGDQVFVRCVDNADLGLGGELYSTFSGYLLYPM